MFKSVDVFCPANLNLFLNIREMKENNLYFKLLNQTVDIYDFVNIKKLRHGDFDIKVISNDKFKGNSSDIYKVANLFFEYVNIKPENYVIEIIKKYEISGLDSENSIIAGVLLGLNHFCSTNLTKRELIFLASYINESIPYYINQAFLDIQKNSKKINKNPFQTYFIIDTNVKIAKDELISRVKEKPLVIKSTSDTILHNDFLQEMPDELIRLHRFLLKYSNLNHSLSGLSSTYFIAGENNIPTNVMLALKKEFKDYKFYNCSNTNGHKCLVKYMKNNQD